LAAGRVLQVPLLHLGFDFDFFLSVSLPLAPFNLPYCRSTLNFPRSLPIT